jgi:general secretion pathway protein I
VSSRDRQQGFSLVEVMIALAILAGGLVLALRSTASNVFAAQRAQMMTAATNLARSKMYDLEEVLLAEGFQEMDQEEDGDFSEEGWPEITWKAEIVKIELPDMNTLEGMTGEGEEAAAAEAPGAGLVPGGMGGMAGAMGAGMMGTYFQMVSSVLEEAIRKVTLTVTYPVLGQNETMVVTCYFTDPSAVNRQIPVAGGGGEEEGGAAGGGTGGAGGRGAGRAGGAGGGAGSGTR